ncbi:hypothetical protein WJ33_10855 [Burkholderia ubonensis]|uniref:Hydrogenase expression protein HupH n=1 Tax=Burkholderia ubonensis TaxID=101571 RepID=A0A124R6J5_9BURK|nr:aspartate/glutamate racemase family protein [Burkholderia ubonensis]KVG52161.1 hypothetical protein WJ33_10855 [Burkholderia ubonensis]
MVKLRIISPHYTEESTEVEDLKTYIRLFKKDGLDISHTAIETGPASIECELDQALATPGTIREVARAANEGIDVAVVACFGDPGVAASREVVRIPVLGPGQTSMYVASLLGHKFSVVTVVETVRPLIENLARQAAIIDKLASIRVINIPVMELGADVAVLNDALAREAAAAVREDHADAIVLGCTGFLGSAEAVTAKLASQDIRVPVIDPLPATIAIARALSELGLTHGPHAYRCDPDKPTRGYDTLIDTLRR